jgi:GTP-binding protein YchF
LRPFIIHYSILPAIHYSILGEEFLGFACGIIGLPNAGKSTIFNALSAAKAEVANYPFCTINPNQGIVPVPDERLQKLAQILHPDKVTPTTLEFWDIAGLVKGASQGEGLGNRFLSHIRNVDAVAHVVRCFEAENVVHVYASLDPRRDIEIIQTELLLADLQVVEKRLSKAAHQAKVGDKKSSAEIPFLEKVQGQLSAGRPAASLVSSEEGQKILPALELLTAKPLLYVANASEKELKERRWISQMEELAAREKAPVVVICGDLEAEMAQLPEAERLEFLQEMGLAESALNQLIRVGYGLLNLITFYTTVGPELRAWTVPRGTRVPQAAGKIHTDMERGFIRAEVTSFNDFMTAGSMPAAREKGMVRVEGRDYIVQDGDILHIRFHA